MIPQATPLFARSEGKIYLVVGWEDDNSRGGALKPYGVQLEPAVSKDRATPLGDAVFSLTPPR